MPESGKLTLGGRYGGEEFAIIVCNSETDEAFLLAERIPKLIRKVFADKEKITISFSVADSRQAGGSRTNLIKAADKVLCQAKERGRDQTVIYQP